MPFSTTVTTNSARHVRCGAVHCVENHDGAYAVWRDAGVTGRVLVHVDAHHDMYGGWIDRRDPKERSRINIANFIYAALEDDLVREVIWVVPDQTWAAAAGRQDIKRGLRGMDQGGLSNKPTIHVESDCMTGTVLGRPIRACTVQNLPALKESVLLDIDIDYFVIPNVGYRGIERYGSLPWCWPDQLLTRLQGRGVRTDLTTIAYSVEGGYTPLQWKYLGDELAQRLQPEPADMRWANHMRSAALATDKGDLHSAETDYLTARDLRPGFAPPYYHLAHLCAATGRLEAGRGYHRRACELDPSYRSPYNNAGWWYLERRRNDQARDAFARTMDLDPCDAYAHLGEALLAVQEGNWPAAETSLLGTLTLNEGCIEAWRALGRVLGRRRAHSDAINAYERSLTLALGGRRALTNPITLAEGHNWKTPWDPDHGVVLAELARIHVATRAWEKAITDYRMAIAAGGIDATAAWIKLALLHARVGRWHNCIHAARQAAKCVPRGISGHLERLRARCWEWMEIWRERRAPKRFDAAAPQVWI